MFTTASCKDPVSVTAFLKRAQIIHKRRKGAFRWQAYIESQDMIGWATTHFRFLGLGEAGSTARLAEGELMFPIELPWTGCGRDLQKLAVNAVNAKNRQLRSQGRPATYQLGPNAL